jgi:hypothetical protein
MKDLFRAGMKNLFGDEKIFSGMKNRGKRILSGDERIFFGDE